MATPLRIHRRQNNIKLASLSTTTLCLFRVGEVFRQLHEATNLWEAQAAALPQRNSATLKKWNVTSSNITEWFQTNWYYISYAIAAILHVNNPIRYLDFKMFQSTEVLNVYLDLHFPNLRVPNDCYVPVQKHIWSYLSKLTPSCEMGSCCPSFERPRWMREGILWQKIRGLGNLSWKKNGNYEKKNEQALNCLKVLKLQIGIKSQRNAVQMLCNCPWHLQHHWRQKVLSRQRVDLLLGFAQAILSLMHGICMASRCSVTNALNGLSWAYHDIWTIWNHLYQLDIMYYILHLESLEFRDWLWVVIYHDS